MPRSDKFSKRKIHPYYNIFYYSTNSLNATIRNGNSHESWLMLMYGICVYIRVRAKMTDSFLFRYLRVHTKNYLKSRAIYTTKLVL